MKKYPKVSVITITYGHENYIKDTLDGVFMQDYPGEIEFIIANDKSPDNTDSVVKNYLETKNIPFNFVIKYTKHKENKGMMSNFIWALKQASGKYIALCEGDDYWTDPCKLREQVGFLEKNESYVLAFTNRDILEKGILKISKPLYNKTTFDKTEIPFRYIPTLTAVFRNVVNAIPSKINNSLIDASLFLFLSQYGSFYYFDKSTAVYRIHEGGVWSGSAELVNRTRSINARVSAWIWLKDIDRVALAHVIKHHLILKKNLELENKKYFLVLKTLTINSLFDLFVKWQLVRRKINL